MKTLRKFWHWYRNEKPDPHRAGVLLPKNLSPLAAQAMTLAMPLVAGRGLPRSDEDWAPLMPALEKLSTAFCAALSDLHEAVPQAEAPGFEPLVCRSCGRVCGSLRDLQTHPCAACGSTGCATPRGSTSTSAFASCHCTA